MSSIDDIVNAFDIGFFHTNINTKNPISLEVTQPPKLADFKATLEAVSTKPYTPPPSSKYVQLDGFTLDENNNVVPTKITLDGMYSQDSFLDENGNWDEEAEARAYKERELKYQKEVINAWIEKMDYTLQNKAKLMKALLATTQS